MSSGDGGQRIVKAPPQPSGRIDRPSAPITGTVNRSGQDLESYLDSEAARYELGAIIRTGMATRKGPREIADDVIAHIKKQSTP